MASGFSKPFAGLIKPDQLRPTTGHTTAPRALPAKCSEKRFQLAVLDLAAANGWRTYHTFDSRRSAYGFPDLVLVRGLRLVFAELKSERGELSPEQSEWLFALMSANQSFFVWRPSDWPDICAVLTEGGVA